MDPVTIALGLAQLAPTLMKYFGVGDKPVAVAQKAIEIAQAVTGKDTGAGALDALKADPAKVLEYQSAVLAADTELEKAYLGDRQGARDRDVALAKAGKNNIRGDVLAYLAVGALVANFVALYVVHNIPDTNEKLLYLAFGALLVIVKDVYGFEFGSSKTGERNAQTIADIAKAP